MQIGLVQPNEEEKEAARRAAEQQGQTPDPMAELAMSQTELLKADAAKKLAEVDETIADTELTRAKTVETLSKLPGAAIPALGMPNSAQG